MKPLQLPNYIVFFGSTALGATEPCRKAGQVALAAMPQVALHSIFVELCKLMVDHLSQFAAESKADARQLSFLWCAVHLSPPLFAQDCFKGSI